MSEGRNQSKVFIGDLPRNASEREIESVFSRYGAIRNVWVARNPPGFAFVEFEDPRDADDAVRKLDGSHICESRVRVEHSTGSSKNSGRRERKPFNPNDRCFKCNERGHYAYDCSRPRDSRSPRRRSDSRDRSLDRHRRHRRRSYSVSSSDSYRRRRSYRHKRRSPGSSRSYSSRSRSGSSR